MKGTELNCRILEGLFNCEFLQEVNYIVTDKTGLKKRIRLNVLIIHRKESREKKSWLCPPLKGNAAPFKIVYGTKMSHLPCSLIQCV
jgi:hypothetical protein